MPTDPNPTDEEVKQLNNLLGKDERMYPGDALECDESDMRLLRKLLAAYERQRVAIEYLLDRGEFPEVQKWMSTQTLRQLREAVGRSALGGDDDE